MSEKYVGQTVEIVYLDQAGNITQRKIEVKEMRGNTVRAVCLKTGAPRTFRRDRILAWQVARTA
ncbi:hypothetical protein ACTHSJ_11995 [Paenibacillus cellulositrophicus]|jgi:predicted DNA-binding transcriptional regulator YafY|uniref:DNA-binding transcriptional regulator YafY n=1 Tax=Paenibacillus favisporus TaxID=221028 RepID=A0ABV2F4S7_9BACL|nr:MULTISPECIES: hypothetical protein [Paenibacillus]MBJ9987350.1 hypothetical protein [Paenibacillus sp. S28]MCM2998032.1 hypothetical protein [Paenibacillus cellulositrophicus]MEC0173918.1 hypothetical protein [Paenibacillus favisporus]PQP89093.1 hypothetical protein CPT76_12965 [Paenibacillus sp. AR247]RED40795.1 hypothetical protein C7820_1962 [Paenibacillus sp. VMFN-D1]